MVKAQLFLLCIVISCFTSSELVAERRKISFSALLALTGSGADQGIRCQRGLQLAADEVKDEFNVDLRFEDTRGEPKAALDAFKSVQDNGVNAVFTWGSGVGMALTPLVNSTHIVQMGLATGTPKYRSPDDYTFRIFHSNDDEARFVSSALAQRWPQGEGAVLRIDNEYGEGFSTVLKDDLKKKGVELVFEDSFLPGTVDFRSQLTRLKSKNPKFLIVLAYPSEGLAIIRQARDLGLSNLSIIGGAALFADEVFNDSAVLSLPALSIVLAKPDSSFSSIEYRKRISERYKNLFNAELDPYDFYTFRSYDAFMSLIDAARTCPTITSTCIKNALYAAPQKSAAFYPIKFDINGDTAASFGFYRPSAKEWADIPQ